jgi:Na+/H+ antiporter NhaC
VTDAVTRRDVREPSLADAVIPLIALVVLIGGSLALFGLDALDGPIQVALVLCAMIAALVVLKNGHRWEDVQAAGQRAVSSITSAIFILLAVGALIGTWNLSGTIPTLVYYGIQVLSPTWYYAASALICGIIAMSIGSSWTTAGTIGTLLEEFGLIGRLIDPMVRAAKGTGRLFLTVFACAFGLNVIAGDQYIALVLPTRVFRAEFARRGLAPTNLSRLAADSGTVTSPLVPWNSCGAFMGAVLGVPTLVYLPFCFFNIASPLLSVTYGFTGFKVEKTGPADA